MFGPFHDFWLVRKGEPAFADYIRHARPDTSDADAWNRNTEEYCRKAERLHRRCEHVELPDSLVWYLNDSLKWVPSSNPHPAPWSGYGLAHWGETIINHTGAEVLYRVIGAWINLFSQGPARIRLRGRWGETHPEEGQGKSVYSPTLPEGTAVVTAITGGYEILDYNREEVIGLLRALAAFAKRASAARHFILHGGV